MTGKTQTTDTPAEIGPDGVPLDWHDCQCGARRFYPSGRCMQGDKCKAKTSTAEVASCEWITFTQRQIELMLWQLLADLGGEISTIPPDDKPGRTVMFYRDQDEYIGMISNEENEDE